MAGNRLIVAAALIALLGCGKEGLSTSDVQAAAKERVRDRLGLTAESALFTESYVGKPIDGDTVICGTVEGKRADGTPVPPQRFIAATDPARWLKFGRAEEPTPQTHPDMFADWTEACASEQTLK